MPVQFSTFLPFTMGTTASVAVPSVAVAASSIAASSVADSSGVFEGDMVNLSRAVRLYSPSMWGVKANGVFSYSSLSYHPVLTFGGKSNFVLRDAVLKEPIFRPWTGCVEFEWFVTSDLDVAQLHHQISGCAFVTHKEADLRIAIHEGRREWAKPTIMAEIKDFTPGKMVPKMWGNLFVYAGRLIFLVFHAEFSRY